MTILGTGNGGEALAESMVPMIGKLYRNGIRLLMYGRPFN
jgi:hypothetical protein